MQSYSQTTPYMQGADLILLSIKFHVSAENGTITLNFE
jgi:hypothetical protein